LSCLLSHYCYYSLFSHPLLPLLLNFPHPFILLLLLLIKVIQFFPPPPQWLDSPLGA
jgi:hypothetical protein